VIEAVELNEIAEVIDRWLVVRQTLT